VETAQLADKYQTMTHAHEHGAEDGYANLPAVDAVDESKTELEIAQIAQNDINEASYRLKSQNDETWESLRSLRAEIPNELTHDIETFATRAELKYNEVERELLRLYLNVLGRQQEYRYFKTLHRLDREADVPASHFVTTALLFFIMVLDGVANAYFFKDSNANALLGGFVFAFMISIANTGMGFSAGLVPWRYLQHRNRLHCLWAFPLLVFLFTMIAIFNLAVGHYRELLLLDKDAQAEQVLSRFLASPIGLHSIPTFILVAAGIGIAMFAAYKGYTFTDSYPRYGRSFTRKVKAEEDFEAKLNTLQTEIGRISDTYQNEAKLQYQRASKAVQKSVSLLDETLSRNETYSAFITGIEEACNAARKTYRDANLKVRDVVRHPAPVYFSNFIRLKITRSDFDPHSLTLAKQELQAVSEKLKTEYENLTHQIPKAVRHLLSETVLNERLEALKKTARRTQREDEKSASERPSYAS
jgi:hypothetical protein